MAKSARQKRRTKKLLQQRIKRYKAPEQGQTHIDEANSQLQKSISNVTQVSDSGLQSKIHSMPSPVDIEMLFTANEDNFKPFIGQYCNKSGKLIYKLSQNNFADLLRIHGRENAFKLLMQMSTENYSIEWLDTSPQTLNKLMVQDYSSYFIYAANHIFQNSDTHSKTDLSFLGMQADCKQKFERLQDKIKARDNLEIIGMLNTNLVIEANELLRRLIGLAKPTKAMLATFFTHTNLVNATQSEMSLRVFMCDIRENLTFLLRRHFNGIRSKTLASHRKLYTITASDIEAIKKELFGLSQFHNQPKIKNQSKRISIMLDLREFVFDEFGENTDDDLLNDFGFMDAEEQEAENVFKLDDSFMGLKVNTSNLQKADLAKQEAISSLKTKPVGQIPPSSLKPSGFKLNIAKRD